MNEPGIREISAEERKLWEEHNLQTLREWRAIPFTQKIQMVEEMEELARAMHGGQIPIPPSERTKADNSPGA
jgi:hypothetical protein